MAIICPTVTAFDQTEYRKQVEEIQSFATRIHIDFMDGILAPTVSPPISDAWWPKALMADFHVMYQKPLTQLEVLVGLQPHLIIIHAEADHVGEFLDETEGLGIKRGLALLPATPVESVYPYLERLDHVLVFSGDLGHFGGKVDLDLLKKVQAIKELHPTIEIGWDGGITAENVIKLTEGGVDILNTGGFIHKSPDPESAYDKLIEILKGSN